MLLDIARGILKVAFWLGIVFLFLVLVWHGAQFIGPRSELPADPLEARARLIESLDDNAAPLYVAAYDALTPVPGPPPELADKFSDPENAANWWLRCSTYPHAESDPLSPALIEWLDTNSQTMRLLHQAAEKDNCAFAAEYVEAGFSWMAEAFSYSQLNTLNRFLRFKARLAVERKDIDAFTEAVLLIDAMARHLGQHPINLQECPQAQAAGASAVRIALLPFAYIPDADLGAYIARVRGICTERQSPEKAFAAERNSTLWAYAQLFGKETIDSPLGPLPLSAFFPLERLAGEYDRAANTALRVAHQPIDAIFAPNNDSFAELQRTIDSFHFQSPLERLFNMPSLAVSPCITDPEYILAQYVRLHAEMRLTDLALSIFEYKLEHGEFPESLAQLPGPIPRDPVSQKAFVYRRTPDGFTLYSLGFDGDDDGGQHDGSFGSKYRAPADGDFVVWPVQW